MFHLAGSGPSLLSTLSRHGTFVLMREWNAALALKLIEAERCNATLLVPTMLASLLDHPDADSRDLSSIQFILTGASPVPPALLNRVTQRIGCPHAAPVISLELVANRPDRVEQVSIRKA